VDGERWTQIAFFGEWRMLIQDFGKTLVVIGLVVAGIGVGIWLAARVGLPLGRLPGDFSYKGKNVSFYFPLGTSVLISIVLSVVLYLISRMRR
jgi:hypothetical protein